MRRPKGKKGKLLKIWYAATGTLFLLATIAVLLFVLAILNSSGTLTSPVSPKVQVQIDVLKAELKKTKVGYTTVEKNADGSYAVKLKDGGQAIVSSKKDIGQQTRTLQLILTRLTIEGKSAKVIDMRFINPLVQF